MTNWVESVIYCIVNQTKDWGLYTSC